MDYADTDILIVELPKKDGYVFAPLSAGTGTEGEEDAIHDVEVPLLLRSSRRRREVGDPCVFIWREHGAVAFLLIVNP